MNVLAPIPNPFGHAIISDAWDPAGIDVPEINARSFQTCLDAFDRVTSGRGSESIVLHGPAGSGKTHLLGRLQHHLVTEQATNARDGALRCIFIAVKLQTSPQMLWQHLRRRVADDLLRVTAGASQLQRLVAHYLADADKTHSARYHVMQIRVLSGIEDPTIEGLLDDAAERARLPYELRKVLSHLVYRRNMAEARGWLRGDPLPEEALTRLGLASGAEVDPEENAREVILSLCRLAGDSLPIVLCFDQIEALQSTTNDASAFFRLGRLLADVFDSDDNILLVTCLQSVVLDLFRRSVRDADWHRLARRESTLDPLDRTLADQLLARRLDAVPELAALRAEHTDSALWPLPPARIGQLFDGTPKVAARRLLMHAEALYEELRTARAERPPRAPEEFLSDELERRLERVGPSYAPSDTDENLRHGLPMLVESLGLGWRRAEPADATVHLAFRRDGEDLELSILDQRNMTSLAAALRALANRTGPQRRYVLRDPRLPISKTAKKTREYLAQLRANGVVLVEPDVEALALLAAIRGILSDARSGDLTHEGLPLAVDRVEAWLRAALDPKVDALLASVFADESGEFTREVSAPVEPRAAVDGTPAQGPRGGQLAMFPGEERQPDLFASRVAGAARTSVATQGSDDADERLQDLVELVSKRFVLALDEAATLLAAPAPELEQLVRAHPTRFGVLSGPPLVVFDWVMPSTGSADEEVSR